MVSAVAVGERAQTRACVVSRSFWEGTADAVESRLPSPVLTGIRFEGLRAAPALSAPGGAPLSFPPSLHAAPRYAPRRAQPPAPAPHPGDPGHPPQQRGAATPSRYAATCWPARRGRDPSPPPSVIAAASTSRQPDAAPASRSSSCGRAGTAPVRTVLYVHGGGFVSGLDRFHWTYAARLARPARRRGSCCRATRSPRRTPGGTPCRRWSPLFEQLAVESPQGVVLMGDSAGGGLAVGARPARRPAVRPAADPPRGVRALGRPDRRDPRHRGGRSRRPVADAEQAPALRHLVGRRRPAGTRRPARWPATCPGCRRRCCCAAPATCCCRRSARSPRGPSGRAST